MIIIKSKTVDFSTDLVVRWLKYYKKESFRINSFDFSRSDLLIRKNRKEPMIVSYGGTRLDENDSYWYRKGAVNKQSFIVPNEVINKFDLGNFMQNELQTTIDVLYESFLKSRKVINHHRYGNLNKQIVLCMAEDCGLEIPEFIITNTKSELEEFFCKNTNVIIKPISNVVVVKTNECSLFPYTHLLTKEEFEILPDRFFPCMFQEYIKKEFEVRSFYLNGRFFSMAMFSQNREKTTIDFRNYDHSNPVRNVPFLLDNSTEKSLRKLFNKLKLNSGSVDLLFCENKNYFLEINPVGQFGMVSYPCNYFLEKEIAKELL